MKTTKGQGALEYLLLIGGAVLVAAIVIVLLLGINATSNTQTQQTTANAMCTTKAGTYNPQAPSCINLRAAPINPSPNYGEVMNFWNSQNSTCYVCSGTYPGCTATKAAPAQQSVNNCE